MLALIRCDLLLQADNACFEFTLTIRKHLVDSFVVSVRDRANDAFARSCNFSLLARKSPSDCHKFCPVEPCSGRDHVEDKFGGRAGFEPS